MQSEFSGKTVVITGAASGMGRATAHRFASDGANVALLDIDSPGLDRVKEELPGGGECLPCVVDVSNADQVERAAAAVAAAFGPADILVNCAAIERWGGLLDASEEDWDRVIDVNLKGTWLVSRAFARGMADHGGGAIVNIASDAAHVGIADFLAYCASKGGIIELTRAMAMDGITVKIRVNCISPGPTNTPLGFTSASGIEKTLVGDELTKYKLRALTGNPMAAVIEPEDVVDAISFLASSNARRITGAVLAVDAGLTASRPFVEWTSQT